MGFSSHLTVDTSWLVDALSASPLTREGKKKGDHERFLHEHARRLTHFVMGGVDLNTWSQIRQDYPLNLSISVSGGKETNKDSLSNGE